MAEAKRVVTGFNHNVKHRGKVYHVQTEDSGLQNPHIITHLFVGGNILASKKTSYADIAGAENLAQVVRELMEEQHKEMLRNLVNGVYDDADATLAEAQHWQPGELGGDAPASRPAPVSITVAVGGPPPGIPAPGATPPPARPPPPEVLAARSAPPPEFRGDAETIIGEDLISEKSLDEVILSYLAEDVGAKK
ncbi:MAG TPA: hypothetical protein VLD85_08115 [Anaeromyxobacteraceae bacterium]|nr:hypothetical protein [Anaeromyxobacteraceae bacterium]